MPDLDPNVQTVRAVITTRWRKKAYTPLPISSIENYYVDTALDNDADTWTLDIGDPNGSLLAMLKRDNEVRVKLYGVGRRLAYIMTGISDEVEFNETDGTWTLTGRDLSSLAIDSTVLPKRWSKARAWSIVKSQAHEIGFHDTDLARTGIVKKTQYTDGSESYWDFWYRLYRQEKMYIWTTPNGVLVAGKVNYSSQPIYFLGDSRDNDNRAIKARCIPVIQAVLTKTTQGRVEEVIVYGQKGNDGFNIKANDPTMRNWIKQPRKVLLDTKSRTTSAGRRMAWEEIYEGKVGSVELKITIPDPGFVVQQNQVARLFLKEIDLYGKYFIVGTRIQGGPDGFIQEIRLRELELALSNRVPDAPSLNTGEPAPDARGGSGLEQAASMPRGWGDYFIKAAKRYHGVMNYQLFLACLLGICQAETGFGNWRENGGPGGDHHVWHPFQPSHQEPVSPGPLPPGVDPAPIPVPSITVRNDKEKWQQMFANEPGVYGITDQMGVGPMQLTSVSLKRAADDLMRPGHRDQYAGGRWHPEFNIMIAAKSFAEHIQYAHAVRDVDIWRAVDAYNRGDLGAQQYFNTYGHVSPYAERVRGYVMKDPGYLQIVNQGVQQADATASQGRYTNPFPVGWIPNRLDMGYDGTFKRKIVAPFDGRIHFAGVLRGNWRGSRGVIIKADQHIPALPSDTWYFAEGITPTVKAGDRVKAGQTIATPSVNPYNGVIGNIEFGLAAQGGVGQQTDPLAETGIKNPRQMVLQWEDWVHRNLGVAHPSSTSDAGYP